MHACMRSIKTFDDNNNIVLMHAYNYMHLHNCSNNRCNVESTKELSASDQEAYEVNVVIPIRLR